MSESASQTGEGTGNGEGQASTPTWIEQLPEDMRTDETFKGYQTIGELATAHKNSLSEREGLVRVPGDEATAEDRAAFNKLLGVPDSADDYELAEPEGLREGLYNKDIETSYRAKVHELGISGKAAAELNNWYYQMMGEGDAKMEQESKASLDEAMNTLKDEWKGDTFKENTTLATRAFSKFAGETDEQKQATQDFLENTKIGNIPLGDHPMFLRVFAGIGQAISDDSSFGRETTSGEMSDEDRAKARFPQTKFK